MVPSTHRQGGKRAHGKEGLDGTIRLTSIAGLVHVFDLGLMTLILIFLCQTGLVYATKQFGYPSKIPMLTLEKDFEYSQKNPNT